jgi:hypothetical protein
MATDAAWFAVLGFIVGAFAATVFGLSVAMPQAVIRGRNIERCEAAGGWFHPESNSCWSRSGEIFVKGVKDGK